MHTYANELTKVILKEIVDKQDAQPFTQKSDVYAFGIIMYLVATGNHLLEIGNSIEI